MSPPRVLTTEDEEGNKLEPIEEVLYAGGSSKRHTCMRTNR